MFRRISQGGYWTTYVLVSRPTFKTKVKEMKERKHAFDKTEVVHTKNIDFLGFTVATENVTKDVKEVHTFKNFVAEVTPEMDEFQKTLMPRFGDRKRVTASRRIASKLTEADIGKEVTLMPLVLESETNIFLEWKKVDLQAAEENPTAPSAEEKASAP